MWKFLCGKLRQNFDGKNAEKNQHSEKQKYGNFYAEIMRKKNSIPQLIFAELFCGNLRKIFSGINAEKKF